MAATASAGIAARAAGTALSLSRNASSNTFASNSVRRGSPRRMRASRSAATGTRDTPGVRSRTRLRFGGGRFVDQGAEHLLHRRRKAQASDPLHVGIRLGIHNVITLFRNGHGFLQTSCAPCHRRERMEMRSRRSRSPVAPVRVEFSQHFFRTGDRGRLGRRSRACQRRRREFAGPDRLALKCIIDDRTPSLPRRAQFRHHNVMIGHKDRLAGRCEPNVFAQLAVQDTYADRSHAGKVATERSLINRHHGNARCQAGANRQHCWTKHCANPAPRVDVRWRRGKGIEWRGLAAYGPPAESIGAMLRKDDTVAFNVASTRSQHGSDGKDHVAVEKRVTGWQGTVNISSRCRDVTNSPDSDWSGEF